jgi:hypothetical protein
MPVIPGAEDAVVDRLKDLELNEGSGKRTYHVLLTGFGVSTLHPFVFK